MDELPLPRRQIMTERMRMAQVRKALGQALEQRPGPDGAAKLFYFACTRYLEMALNRLHAQDQRIIDKLRARVAAEDEASHALLSDFHSSLEASRKALRELLQALQAYQQDTGASREDYENAALRFMDVFLNILAARRHSSLHLEEQYFDLSDWEAVAGVTSASLALERELFSQACEVAPPSARSRIPSLMMYSFSAFTPSSS